MLEAESVCVLLLVEQHLYQGKWEEREREREAVSQQLLNLIIIKVSYIKE